MNDINQFSIIKNLTDEELIQHQLWDEIKNNIYLCVELLNSGNFKYLNLIPAYMFDNYSVSLKIFNYSNPDTSFIPESLLLDNNFIITALNKNYNNILFIPEKYLNQDIIYWFCLKYPNHSPLTLIPDKYKNENLLIQSLIELNPNNYIDTSNSIKNDLTIFNIIQEKNQIEQFFKFSGDSIRNNKYICSEAIKKSIKLYANIGNKLKNNEEYFIELIKQDLNLLEFASPFIKDSSQCVLASYIKFPTSLKYASNRLLNSSDFLSQIYDSNIEGFELTFQYCGTNIFNDIDFCYKYMAEIIKSNFFYLLSPTITNNYAYMKESSLIDINSLHFLGDKLSLNSNLFIELYKEIHLTNKKIGTFNLDSQQNKIFEHISQKAANNLNFLVDLNKEFNHIFEQIILPKIKHLEGPLINILNDNNNSLQKILSNLELQSKLNSTLPLFDKQEINKI